jgi:hypothetical protein
MAQDSNSLLVSNTAFPPEKSLSGPDFHANSRQHDEILLLSAM